MTLTLVFYEICCVCGFRLGLWKSWRYVVIRFSNGLGSNIAADTLGNYYNIMFKMNLNLSYYD